MGFTLVELVVSLFAAVILTAALAGTVTIALQASDPANTPDASAHKTIQTIDEMATELQYAVAVTEQTSTAITVVVPDRNDLDTMPETVRYAWSGVPGDPLTRRFNGNPVAVFAEDVHDFQVDYVPPTSPRSYLNVRLQIGQSPQGTAETAIPLLNGP